jgi:hypothetical protein
MGYNYFDVYCFIVGNRNNKMNDVLLLADFYILIEAAEK